MFFVRLFIKLQIFNEKEERQRKLDEQFEVEMKELTESMMKTINEIKSASVEKIREEAKNRIRCELETIEYEIEQQRKHFENLKSEMEKGYQEVRNQEN